MMKKMLLILQLLAGRGVPPRLSLLVSSKGKFLSRSMASMRLWNLSACVRFDLLHCLKKNVCILFQSLAGIK
jgi:hypothetical protein